MLVSGELIDRPVATVGNGVRGTTSTCNTHVGRGWTVTDTMGFGEPKGGTVPAEEARRMVIEFLKEVKGRYSHIVIVHDKGRFDMCTKIIWKTFLENFHGGERNFVVLFTKVDEDSWLEENRADIEEECPECKQFLCVDFPGVDKDDPEMEELNEQTRQEELNRLEKEMQQMFKASPWVEPDIFRMGDEEIRQKADSILKRIAAFIKKLMRDYGVPDIYQCLYGCRSVGGNVHLKARLNPTIRRLCRLEEQITARIKKYS